MEDSFNSLLVPSLFHYDNILNNTELISGLQIGIFRLKFGKIQYLKLFHFDWIVSKVILFVYRLRACRLVQIRTALPVFR